MEPANATKPHWFMSYLNEWCDGTSGISNAIIGEHPLAWQASLVLDETFKPTVLYFHKMTEEDIIAARKAKLIHD